jgi:adenine-specific DNA methylase
MSGLKSILHDLINERTEDAAAGLHTYLAQKLQVLAGLTEAKEPTVKAYKIKLKSKGKEFDELSDKKKEQLLFGDDKIEGSWAENQEIVTIEYIDLQGNVLYVHPYLEDAYDSSLLSDLQHSLDKWSPKKAMMAED